MVEYIYYGDIVICTKLMKYLSKSRLTINWCKLLIIVNWLDFGLDLYHQSYFYILNLKKKNKQINTFFMGEGIIVVKSKESVGKIVHDRHICKINIRKFKVSVLIVCFMRKLILMEKVLHTSKSSVCQFSFSIRFPKFL